MSEKQTKLTPEEEREFDRQDKIGRATHDQINRDLGKEPSGSMSATRRAAGLAGTGKIMNEILPEASEHNAARQAEIASQSPAEDLTQLLQEIYPKDTDKK